MYDQRVIDMDFAKSKKERDIKYKEKDKIVTRIINSINIKDPKTFKAILMPCLYGVELYLLHERGVPNENIYPIERDFEIHNKQKYPGKRHPRLWGINTTDRPQSSEHAIDVFATEEDYFDLIYLDYFSRMNEKIAGTLLKIFEYPLVKKDSVLMFTLGNHRCCREDYIVNKAINNSKKGRLDIINQFIKNAGEKIDPIEPEQMKEYPYISEAGKNKKIHYRTTVITF